MIYFCGIYQILNNSNLNVIGSFPKDMLSTGSTTIDLYPINIPNNSVLKKIDFYRAFGSGKKKLSLIANDDANTFVFSGNNEIVFPPSYFITYDLLTDDYHAKEVENVRLTDVVHTSTKVAVVGILDKEPYNATTHTSFMIVPNMMSFGKNLLKSITLYKGIYDHCYLAFGALDNRITSKV